MSIRTHNFRIGLFVLFGALLFIGALLAMGITSYFGQRVVLETCLPGHVENLSIGALVKLRGITIGKVSKIEFAAAEYPKYKTEAVLIHFEVPKEFDWGGTGELQKMLDQEIAKGLRARVQGQGFLGASIVSLEYVDPAVYPVEPIPWKPIHPYIPSAPSQFNRVFGSLEKTLRHVEDLDLADLIHRVNGLIDRVEVVIDSANQLVGNVNHVNFDQLGTNANALVTEFRETNRGIQATLTDARTAINGVNLPGLGKDTAALEARLSNAAIELRRLLTSVDTGELNNSLVNIREATDELTDLLHKLDQRPASVLFSKPPKPLKELETPPRK